MAHQKIINIAVIAHVDAGKSTLVDAFLAQGGICVLRDESDYDAYFEDTMRAGHYENTPESVKCVNMSHGIRQDIQIVQNCVQRLMR